MNFNSNNNINNQFGCLPLHSIRLPLRLRLRLRINRLNSKNKQQHTTACTKPRQMQQVRVPGMDLTIDIHPACFTGPVQEIAIVSTVSDWALSWELTWPTATRPRPSSPGPGSHPWPGSDLWRPGVTDTGHSPSSPATLPYSVSPLTPQHSSKYCTIFWNKDKTTGSFTINIPKILSYCCTIYSDHLSLF